MASGKPLWLRAILRLERAIGEPLESALRSDTYFDVVTGANRAVTRLGGTVEGVTRKLLHLRNKPTFSDIRAVREQLARMERTLAEAVKQLRDLERPAADPVVKPPDPTARVADAQTD
jgi:hypothetical protein